MIAPSFLLARINKIPPSFSAGNLPFFYLAQRRDSFFLLGVRITKVFFSLKKSPPPPLKTPFFRADMIFGLVLGFPFLSPSFVVGMYTPCQIVFLMAYLASSPFYGIISSDIKPLFSFFCYLCRSGMLPSPSPFLPLEK